MLRNQPGYIKVGAEPGRWLLHARFHFPEIARQRYADLFAEITVRTGWQLTITVPGSREAMEQAPRMAQGEAMARITATFSGVLELYRIGVDSRLKMFWLRNTYFASDRYESAR
jgi:hypothetical protein